MKKIRISELPLSTSLKGLFTIGVNARNKSVKIPIESIAAGGGTSTDRYPSVLPFDDYAENANITQGSLMDDEDPSGGFPIASQKEIVWDKAKEAFLCRKDGIYYSNWNNADNYGEFSYSGRKPREGVLFYHRTRGEVYTWNGTKLLPIVGSVKVEVIENATRITEEEIDKIINE